jgi:hypothetical protein
MTSQRDHAHDRCGADGHARGDWVALLSKDFLSGLLFAGFGIWGLALGWNFPIGTASRMGPGYFPQLLSWGVIAIGVILMVRALLASQPGPIARMGWRALVLVITAIVLFGVLAERIGMVLSIPLLIGIGGAACMDSRWREVAISTVLLTAFAVAVFKYGLGLPMPVWPR